MSVFAELRMLGLLRRIARALERQCDSLSELQQIERERWTRELKLRAKPKPTEFASFDITEANERYAKELEAAEFGGTLEDRSR